jgi:hypothetical protein
MCSFPRLTDRMKLFDSFFKKKKKKKKKIMIRSRSRDRFCSRSIKGTRGVLWRESRFFLKQNVIVTGSRKAVMKRCTTRVSIYLFRYPD